MADNTVNLTLKLKPEGVEKLEQGSKNIKDNFKSAESSAQNLGGAMPGGSTYSRRAASSAAAKPTGAAGVSAGVGGDVEEYNRLSGAAGKAGGSARDFADQARGLGGFVRLYATFAANIFAVSAAFNALSRAADTTNLVKGLDQLGASSGRNLGTLSKKLVIASDGAINLRDAMEATAKASSAGLSNKQIEQLAEGAKKASQALGVSMPDALSRLTRGVSKLEPELLDELGIYVKIDDAVTNYARSVGKTASALSDFERRQAFAIATTKQLQEKFANVSLDVNPYTKLSATLQNLLQTGLELLNKFLTPVIKYLSESPVALATVIGALGITLLKQVIPVLGEFREGLKRSAEEAAASARRIQQSFGDEFQSRLEARFSLPKLNTELKKTESRIEALSSKTFTAPAMPASLTGLKSLENLKYDDSGLKRVEDLIVKRKQYVETGMQGEKKLSSAAVQAYREQINYLTQIEAEIKRKIELEELSNKKKEQAIALTKAEAAAQAVADKSLRATDPELVAQRRLEIAQGRTLRTQAVSNAAESANIVGIRASWTLLNKEIADKGITGINKYITLAQGGLAAIGSRVMGLVSAFGMWAVAIGAVVAVWEVLDNFFSKNKKQAAETAEAFDKLKSNTEFVDKVFDDLSKKDPLLRVSTEAITARANSFRELTDSIESSFQKLALQIENANWWDKLKDRVKGVFGQDVVSVAARDFSVGIAKAFKALGEGSQRQLQAVEKFKQEFGIDPRDQKAFEQVLVKDPQKFTSELMPKAIELSKQLGVEFVNIAGRSSTLKTSLEEASKTLKDFVTSSLPTDPISKFGAQLIKIGTELESALKDPETALASIVDIVKSPDLLAVLGESGKYFVENRENILATAKSVGEYQTSIQKAREALRELNQTQQESENVLAKIDEKAKKRAETSDSNKVKYKSDEFASRETAILDIKISTETKELIQENIRFLNRAASTLPEVAIKSAGDVAQALIKRGVEYVGIGIAIAFQKAAAIMSGVFAELTSNTVEGIKAKAVSDKEGLKLQIAQLNIQSKLIDSNSNVQDSLEKLSIETERLALAYKESRGVTLSKEEQTRKEKLDSISAGKDEETNKLKQAQDVLRKEAKKGILAQIEQFVQQIRSVEFGSLIKQQELLTKNANERLGTEVSILETRKKDLELSSKSLIFLGEESLRRKQSLEATILEKQQQQELNTLQGEIEKREKAREAAREDLRKDPNNKQRLQEFEAIKASIAKAEDDRNRAIDRQARDRNTQQKGFANEVQDRSKQQRDFELETERLIRIAQEKTASAYENMAEIRRQMLLDDLESAKKYGVISETEYVREKARFELEKQRRDYAKGTRALEAAQVEELQPTQKQQQQLLTATGVQTREELATKVQAPGADSTLKDALAQYDELQKRIQSVNSSYQAQRAELDLNNEAKLRSIEITKQEQLANAKLADTFGKLAEVLAALGETGKRFGEGLLGLATAQSKYEQQSLALSTDTSNKKADLAKTESALINSIKNSDYDSDEDREKAIREIREKNTKAGIKIDEDAAKKGTKLELDRNIAVLNSGKKMFKEKTAAYKVMDAMEKGMHVYKMIMLGKEMAAEAIATVKSIASTISQMASVGVLAVLNQGKGGDPWTAFARMAAMAATVGALISSVGGGSGPKVQAGSTAQDRQETQGTGMEWRDGQKVETGRGVFGDPEAKSQSIANSLERIKDTNVEGITYASRTVKLLESIDRAIGGAAQELYGVQGLRAGTAFGTKEGTTSSGIQGLFGSKTSKEIIDAGIKFAGSFLDVMSGKAGSIMQYETSRTTKTSSGFLGIGGGTKTWESTLEKDLGQVNQTAAKEVSKIFTNAGDLMIELGGQLGQTQEQVLSSLSKVNLTGRFASLRGLKGEELQKELSAVISSILDDAATVAFKSLEKFRKFGEGMAETVIRVLDTNQKISDSFVSMGGKTLDTLVRETFGNQQITETVVTSVRLPMDQMETAIRLGFSRIAEVAGVSWFRAGEVITEQITRPISEAELKQKSLEISEGLAELAGGLDKFLEKQKFFVDNFLTEAERLAPIREALTDQLEALGLGFVDTREEFKQVVLALGQNVTTEGGRELYNSVLSLAPAFNEVYEEVEDVKEALSTLDLRKKLLDQEITILGLLGREQEALNLKRERELDELRKYPGLQGELLAANQEYIYALEDERAAKDRLIKQRDKEKQAFETTVKSITTAIDTLSKYRSTLLTGSLTTLTPGQQYQENRARFEELSGKLRTGTTEERVAAASELQALGDKFLESSRAMFASSSVYASDFDTVLSVLDESTALLSTQKTDAEKSLEELMRSTSFLDTIDDNTKTTSELLAQYLTAQQTSQEQDRQRQDLRQQWEQSLLASITSTPEVTLDVQPIVTELVQVKNALLQQSTATAAQTTAAVAVSHADLQSILAELEKLRKAQEDMVADTQRQVFAPVWESTGGD